MKVSLTESETKNTKGKSNTFIRGMTVVNEQVISFPDGIPGFERLTKYILGKLNNYPPFKLMTAQEDKAISLLLLSEEYIYNYYRDFRILLKKYCGIYTNGQSNYFDIYFILQYDHKTQRITANLQAPIIIENRCLIGKQLILDTDELSPRYPLIPVD